MFAKLFKKNASFDPSELTCLPDLEPSAQVALLDQYLLYCKEHEHSADEQSVALALLAPYAAGSANGTDIAGAELEVVKRALSLVGDAGSIQPLLDHSSLGDLAAKRICKLLPIDSAHPTNGHERVFQARLQTATAPDIAALSKRVVTAEQAAWLVIRATNETKDDLLNLPVLQGEAGLVTLEKISRGHDKSSNRLARQKLETLRICRQQLNASVEALTEVHASTERELKLEAKDVDSLIVQRKKLNQLHSRQGQLLEDIARAQSELQAAGEPQTPYALQTDPFASIDLSVPDSQDNPYPALTNQLSELRHSIASLAEMSQEASGHYKTTLTSINEACGEPTRCIRPVRRSETLSRAITARLPISCRTGTSSCRFHGINWSTLPAAMQPARRRKRSPIGWHALAKRNTLCAGQATCRFPPSLSNCAGTLPRLKRKKVIWQLVNKRSQKN